MLIVALAFTGKAHAAPAADPSPVAALRAALQAPSEMCAEPHLKRLRVAPFYPADDVKPIWFNGNHLTHRAEILLGALRAADQEGLSAQDYLLEDIEAYLHANTPAKKACLELLLTAAFNDYGHDVYSGRDSPSTADPTWHFTPPKFDPVVAISTANTERAFRELIDSLPPPHAAYRRLRMALAQYRKIAQQGGWSLLPAGPTLVPGDPNEQIPLLRKRLEAEGDLRPTTASSADQFDPALAEAVQRFQRRNGLKSDGIVGPNTRAVLNIPVAERVAEIRRAMERWRWLPRDFGERYVLVNTASYELTVIDRGKSALAMRVITGQLDQATPSFSAKLTSIIINPYWNVPMRIARDVLLPRQQHNPHYFQSRGFRLFKINGNHAEVDPDSVDWRYMNGGDFYFRVRQEPGPINSMGRLAFYFPNPFDVFLHGTPERWLFERDTRTFSEGCVRIEHPIALALYVLGTDSRWTRERIQQKIDWMRHETLRVPQAIPVYVLYLPSWVDDRGNVHFAKDVYKRDEILARDYPAR